jgi:hypothetical protein
LGGEPSGVFEAHPCLPKCGATVSVQSWKVYYLPACAPAKLLFLASPTHHICFDVTSHYVHAQHCRPIPHAQSFIFAIFDTFSAFYLLKGWEKMQNHSLPQKDSVALIRELLRVCSHQDHLELMNDLVGYLQRDFFQLLPLEMVEHVLSYLPLSCVVGSCLRVSTLPYFSTIICTIICF